MKKHSLGVLLVLAAAFMWSFSGVGVKRLTTLDSLSITGFRSIFTVPVLLITIFLLYRDFKTSINSCIEGWKKPIVWGSALFYAATLIFFISSTKYTTAANAIFLQYTAPIYAALFSKPITGEKSGLWDWTAALICIFGMGFFFSGSLSTEGFWGNILGIISGITAAFNAMFLRLMNNRETERHGVTSEKDFQNEKNGLGLTLPAVLLGNFIIICVTMPWMLKIGVPHLREFAILSALGIFQLGIPYVFFITGMAWVTAVEGIVIGTLEAVLNPIWTAFGAGEIPTSRSLLGGAIILVSITIYGIFKPKKPSPSQTCPNSSISHEIKASE
ncbi:MAG: DMT family transporter [Candidatus Riflebacteria bacterium]|nr:DMT family transporter [Candidatus Riflebacteria bacterium]